MAARVSALSGSSGSLNSGQILQHVVQSLFRQRVDDLVYIFANRHKLKRPFFDPTSSPDRP